MLDEELIHVDPTEKIQGLDRHRPVRTGDEKQHGRHKQQNFRRMRDYFRTLAKAAEESNKRLAERKNALRFCVYLQGDQVFIDIVRLDDAGKVASTVHRNITEEDFNHWIEDIAGMEGLLLDQQA